ncbi:hypothetical protein BHM03_00059453 [Ensete ventricosum]|nr:hypothetical protein BHM03_00059453 [Ensete ventricosum]
MRSCRVRDTIIRRYDKELLGAPLWCVTRQEEELWIQGVDVMVPQRRVFVCASELALDESLSHQHMGAVYYRGRSPSASTSESYGGGRDHVKDQELLGAPLWEIVYPCIPDPDEEDEGGQASSSIAVSRRWISVAKLLQSDLATLV